MSVEGKEIIDISPLITPSIAVFPGDKTFERNIALSQQKGDNLDLSSINTTVHLGAHTDAPNHYHKEGDGIEKADLKTYMGKCQVITVKTSDDEGRIRRKDINTKISSKRVLLKTKSFPDPNNWNDDFWSLHPDLVTYLSENGVKLIGIDTPSVDPAKDSELKSHNRIYESGLRILEGIVLDNVDEGEYELVALPLKIADCDASPVRAVLFR